MRDLTIIIPTYNMGRYLPALLESIVSSDLSSCLSEIIVVCDRSSDGSEQIIRDFILKCKTGEVKFQLIEREERKGVFVNRWIGAQAAKTSKLLFLDSRITLPAATGLFIKDRFANLTSLCAVVDIDASKNIFNLYWLRSHEALFRRREQDLLKGPIEIRPENFDQYVVGTTGFFCSRSVFLEPFLGAHVYNDDTHLMKAMSAREPILIHPQFRIHWEPRDRASEFLKHLYHRGPGFAEYHVFEKRGALFYGLVCGILFLLMVLALLIVAPLQGLIVLAVGLLMAAASTLLFAKSLKEFIELAPLHVGVLAAFGFGAIRGIAVIAKKRRLKSST
jgi:glycosyltransferase involved in cell wall biosynthesis